MTKTIVSRSVLMACTAIAALAAPGAMAQDGDELAAIVERLDRLERENSELRAEVEALRNADAAAPAQPRATTTVAAAGPQATGIAPTVDEVAGDSDPQIVGVAPDYGFAMLDHAESVNTKPLLQLRAIADGTLDDTVTFSGSVTAIVNYQNSNIDDTFGYLMRHPTGANQNGKHVSEAVLHSAQLAFTARLADGFTGYAELLYDPQQSFGTGTITTLTRNQVQLRRGWVMVGDLERSPAYALLGKMDIPFGLQDTVSPFTNSTNWHAFAGLAYGAQVGYYADGLSLRGMAIQGGAQFRGANAPVNGTAIPSRLNNFAVDASYEAEFAPRYRARFGASYQHATAYCQGYPVFHFNPCEEPNGAWAAYGKADLADLTLLGEFARTTDIWKGTAVPDPTNPLSEFEAVKVTSFTFGGRYGFGANEEDQARREFAVSAEFSRFIAGDDGSPWEAQSQFVAGLSWFPVSNVNLFGEFIRADGFVPLNFLSGGNLPGGATWSRQDALTNVLLFGMEESF